MQFHRFALAHCYMLRPTSPAFELIEHIILRAVQLTPALNASMSLYIGLYLSHFRYRHGILKMH